jgi:hypothetical protein
MKTRVLLALFLVLAAGSAGLFVAPRPVEATDNSTFCKWAYPWPRTVNYFIHVGFADYQFSGGDADRVAYGANTWNETNANLIFQRVYDLASAKNSGDYAPPTDIYKVYEPGDTFIAQATLTKNGGCDLDRGDANLFGIIEFNTRYQFHWDCAVVYPQCERNGWHDLHNIAAHEFGHWIHLRDNDVSADTMYRSAPPGEITKRDLTFHDIDGLYVMYGRR